MRLLICRAILVGALALAGCARHHSNNQGEANYAEPPVPAEPPPAGQLIVTGAEGLSGKVSSVNLALRFVVLTFPVGQMPSVSQQLNLYRNGLKVGVVTVTGPQREDSTVADIQMGEAAIGDEARDK